MIKNLRPQLAEAGKIKIGGLGEERTTKTGRKWRAPQKYSSFVITKNQRDKEGKLIVDKPLMDALIAGGYAEDGRHVREIPVVLHSNDIESVFPTSYASYVGRKLQCRGDGETALTWDKDRRQQQQRKCPCELLGNGQQVTCKPNGTLHCSIMLPGHATAGAVYKWRTTSIISIPRMVGSLQQILATVGVLRGIPLRLKVEPVQVSPNGQDTTVYCCHLELKAADITQVQRDAMAAARARQELAAGLDIDKQYKQLVAPPGLDESPQEQQETADEFYPEVEPMEPAKPGSVTTRLRAKLKEGKNA